VVVAFLDLLDWLSLIQQVKGQMTMRGNS
jgi:hypothetical protein